MSGHASFKACITSNRLFREAVKAISAGETAKVGDTAAEARVCLTVVNPVTRI